MSDPVAPFDSSSPNYKSMGYLGRIDPVTELLRSYDSGLQSVGQPYFRDWWFEFYWDASLGQRLRGSVLVGPQYGAEAHVHLDLNHHIGPLGGPYTSPLMNAQRYFVIVTTKVGITQFHFSAIGVPALEEFPNDAGRTSDNPKALGELDKFFTVSNSFYTYFPRAQITNSSGPGQLVPDFGNPTPWAPSPDWYSFRLRRKRRVKLVAVVGKTNPKYVIHMTGGFSSVIAPGHVIDLGVGDYKVAVYDQKTEVTGGGGGQITAIRNPKAENFEHYRFELIATNI